VPTSTGPFQDRPNGLPVTRRRRKKSLLAGLANGLDWFSVDCECLQMGRGRNVMSHSGGAPTGSPLAFNRFSNRPNQWFRRTKLFPGGGRHKTRWWAIPRANVDQASRVAHSTVDLRPDSVLPRVNSAEPFSPFSQESSRSSPFSSDGSGKSRGASVRASSPRHVALVVAHAFRGHSLRGKPRL